MVPSEVLGRILSYLFQILVAARIFLVSDCVTQLFMTSVFRALFSVFTPPSSLCDHV